MNWDDVYKQLECDSDGMLLAKVIHGQVWPAPLRLRGMVKVLMVWVDSSSAL